jgi:4-hydroxy-2-oxoheptanedioate aldolase
MRENAALAKWRRGESSIGGWLLLGNTHTAEMMANGGFDWLVVDMQHGLIDYRDLTHMLPAISTTATTPLVRVSSNDPAEIMKALDAGAMGVIVPMVNTREQAVTAISACRYPPEGTRSFGPVRAALYGGPGYATEANSQIACIIMIETMEGLENLQAIVSAPGLGGVFVGPADLALALGTPLSPDFDDPRHVAAVDKILSTCKQFGVPAGIFTIGPNSARRRLAAGFNFVTLGADATFMMQALTADMAAVRAPPTAKNTGDAGSGPYGGGASGR